MKKAKMISKIVSGVTSFYLDKKVANFDIEVTKIAEKDEYTVYSCGKMDLTEEEFEKIKKNISMYNDTEYDGYWELIGESEEADELILLSRICDFTEIKYEEGILELILKKKHGS